MRTAILGVLLLAFNTSAQKSPAADDRLHKRVDQQLSLTLSLDQTDGRSDSAALQSCLAHHPPIACRLLTITVQNEGTDIILIWRSTCGEHLLQFDLRKPDGNWEAFPADDLIRICTSSTVDVEKLSPGASHIEHVRLGDYDLHLDTAYPPLDDGLIHPRHPAYEFLVADGPRAIRVGWYAGACIASDKLAPNVVPGWFFVESYCAEGTQPEKGISLQSNELKLGH